MHWLTGVFGDDLAFHMTGIEHTSSDPVWRDVYPVDGTVTAANNWSAWSNAFFGIGLADSSYRPLLV